MKNTVVCVQDVIDAMDVLAPPVLALPKDRIGLQVGDRTKPVQRVWAALEATPDIVAAAIKADVDMIVTHHALLYHPLHTIDLQNVRHQAIAQLLTHGIAVYTAHTNLDVAWGGVNDVIAKRIGLQDIEILDVTYRTRLWKLAVYVPRSHVDSVRDAVANAGAGAIGDYTHCMFAVDGIGTFMPGEGTTPFIGQPGQVERVEETKLETIVPESILDTVLVAMKQAHPYEEVAYDVLPLRLRGPSFGIGRIGVLSEKTTLDHFANTVKQQFHLPHIRYVGEDEKPVHRVAVLGGSGSEWIDKARQQGADVLVTADVGHHAAADAWQDGMAIVDVTHAALEEPVCGVIGKRLQQMLGNAVTVEAAPISTDPFHWR